MTSNGLNEEPTLDAEQTDLEWNTSIDTALDTERIHFTVYRYMDTLDPNDYKIIEDEVIRMGYAIRDYVVEEHDNSEIITFGKHVRHGYFDMVLHPDQTSAMWGVYIDGAISMSSSLLIAGLAVLSTLTF